MVEYWYEKDLGDGYKATFTIVMVDRNHYLMQLDNSKTGSRTAVVMTRNEVYNMLNDARAKVFRGNNGH